MHKVLVVEDDANIARVLAIRLRAKGYRALTADDAHSGYNVAHSQHPDLILLDINMPAGGGIRMAERLRAESATADIPIIFLTASRNQQVRQHALRLNPVAFMEKPYNARHLMGTIDRTLAARPEAMV